MLFGGDKLKFNNVEKEYIEVRYEEARPLSPLREAKTITVPRSDGTYLSRVETGIRELIIPVNVYYDDFEDLQKKKEDLAEWLIHDEPKPLVFPDEEDRTYYALY